MTLHKYIQTPHTFKVVRSTPDPTVQRFAFSLSNPIAVLPPSVDLRPNCPPVYDQGSLGSCTGNAIAAAVEYDLMKQGKPAFQPSRLFIYYNERLMEGDVGEDAGAQIHDGIKAIANYGVCPESLWPYNPSQFTVKPSDAAYAAAAQEKALNYYSVEITIGDLKQALAQGYPVVIGMQVFQAMESEDVAQSGSVPMPGPYDQSLGGHCVLVVGYDDAKQHLIVRNSWGKDWGLGGYFTLPYAYVTPNLMTDFWVVTAVS
jgi:C1A family cysteine protease